LEDGVGGIDLRFDDFHAPSGFEWRRAISVSSRAAIDRATVLPPTAIGFEPAGCTTPDGVHAKHLLAAALAENLVLIRS
jgi:hypothetical protein